MEALKAGEASRLVTICSESTACPGKPGRGRTRACPRFSQVSGSLRPCGLYPPGSSVHGIPRQACWSGLPFPPLGGLLDPGMESVSPLSPASAAGSLEERPLGSLVFQGRRRKRQGEARLAPPAVCPGTPLRGLPACCDALLRRS